MAKIISTHSFRGGTGKSNTFHYVDITALDLGCVVAKDILRQLQTTTPLPSGWKLTNGRLHPRSPYPLEGILRKGREMITFRYACGGC